MITVQNEQAQTLGTLPEPVKVGRVYRIVNDYYKILAVAGTTATARLAVATV